MNRLKQMLVAVAVALAVPFMTANATDIRINGTVSYDFSGNQVRMRIESLYNASTNITSGTLHVRMWATPTPDVINNGYVLAEANLGQFTSNNGQLSPGFGYSNLDMTVPFTRPPDGTWYIHFYVSEFPNLSTVLDYRTFSNTLTWGQPTNPPPPPPVDPGNGGDDGDAFETATPVGANSSRSASIETGGDVDMFRVDLGGPGVLSVWTTGSTDTMGTLYDSAGNEVAFNDDIGGDLNFGMDARLQAGTYFIKVEGYNEFVTGDYMLDVSFDADAPAGGGGSGGGGGGGGGGNIIVDDGSGGGAMTPFMLVILLMAGIARAFGRRLG